MDDQIKSFLEYVFQVVEGVERVAQNDTNFKACNECGTTFGGFKKAGKLGCAYCYETFRSQMSQILQSIHYNPGRHVGKIPFSSDNSHAELLAHRELENTRNLLQEAIKEERYEDAARFRDRINLLLSEGGGNND